MGIHRQVEDEYKKINKYLVRMTSIREAFLISHLASLQEHFKIKYDSDWFYQVAREMQNEVNLSEKQLRLVINKLRDLKYLKMARIGRDAKNWYSLDVSLIFQDIEVFKKNIEVTPGVSALELRYLNDDKLKMIT